MLRPSTASGVSAAGASPDEHPAPAATRLPNDATIIIPRRVMFEVSSPRGPEFPDFRTDRNGLDRDGFDRDGQDSLILDERL